MNFVPGMQLSNVWMHGFVSGFLASGGDARAGMMGMMSAGLASKVGGFADAQELGNFGRSALHGITQGAIAAAGGGRFGDGALGAFSGSLLSFIPEAVAGPYGTGGDGAKIGRMVAAAAVGGTASKIGGGKFANGAWSAAFVSRFNHESNARRQPTIEISIGYTDTPVGLGTNHALVIATDPNTGEQYATRAGPGLNRRGGCCVIEAESSVYDHTFRDNPANVHTVQHVGSVDISLEVFAARAAEFAAVTNHNSVPYTGFGTNSNSYAFSFVESLGLGRPTPAVWAPGWRSGSPSRELTYP